MNLKLAILQFLVYCRCHVMMCNTLYAIQCFLFFFSKCQLSLPIIELKREDDGQYTECFMMIPDEKIVYIQRIPTSMAA